MEQKFIAKFADGETKTTDTASELFTHLVEEEGYTSVSSDNVPDDEAEAVEYLKDLEAENSELSIFVTDESGNETTLVEAFPEPNEFDEPTANGGGEGEGEE